VRSVASSSSPMRRCSHTRRASMRRACAPLSTSYECNDRIIPPQFFNFVKPDFIQFAPLMSRYVKECARTETKRDATLVRPLRLCFCEPPNA